MNNIKSDQILLRPLITEKWLKLQSLGKYAFKVSLQANKHQVSQAFYQVFGQKPLKVNLVVLKGKTKNNWRTRQKFTKSTIKKAIISLPPGQKIELLSLKTK